MLEKQTRKWTPIEEINKYAENISEGLNTYEDYR